MPNRRRQMVLVTGCTGHIGSLVVGALEAAGHRVRGFDRVEHPTLQDQVVGDLTDPDAVHHAVAGVEQVVHLAAHATTADFVGVLVPANVVGAYQVVRSAVEARVGRIILASSIQVIGSGWLDARQPVGVDEAAPEKDYALTKLWVEQLGRMVAATHDIEVLVARLGWFVRDGRERRRMEADPRWQSVYLARSDAARFFCAAVDAPPRRTPGRFATIYAVGPGTAAHPCPVDLDPGRRLIGYEPRVRWPDEAPAIDGATHAFDPVIA